MCERNKAKIANTKCQVQEPNINLHHSGPNPAVTAVGPASQAIPTFSRSHYESEWLPPTQSPASVEIYETLPGHRLPAVFHPKLKISSIVVARCCEYVVKFECFD
ncbi:hypothetical protein M407DRAFT_154456 [Tulasnella calospora MUT 4182]|uniref:Uncharacterized protein n=1 Tax=Tulasnella calospora MUT 4182 TaxID=1051891 RepID=A0A0C3PVC8_9AGAM|nr:hypothetical protein M407DRAFT_154456 [Tulasnella calospora MUT 4182]